MGLVAGFPFVHPYLWEVYCHHWWTRIGTWLWTEATVCSDFLSLSLCHFSVPGARPGFHLAIVSPLLWNSFVDFLLSWRWQSREVVLGSFAQHPSVRACPMHFSWWGISWCVTGRGNHRSSAHSGHISRVNTIYVTYHGWCWPWAPGLRSWASGFFTVKFLFLYFCCNLGEKVTVFTLKV